jgi:hypothetical protein
MLATTMVGIDAEREHGYGTQWTNKQTKQLFDRKDNPMQLVEWSGAATGLDQWLPVFLPFRALWQMAIGSCPRFPYPLCSSRTASCPRYGWKPALSLRALRQPSPAAFDAEPAPLSVSGSEFRRPASGTVLTAW